MGVCLEGHHDARVIQVKCPQCGAVLLTLQEEEGSLEMLGPFTLTITCRTCGTIHYEY